MKLKLLLKHLQDNSPFGCVLAHVSVIEFQKRGLVHSHIILFIDQDAKFALQDPLQIDNHISAEIRPPSDHSLRETVLRQMIHNPCNSSAASPCQKEGGCSKRFPKSYRLETGSVEAIISVITKEEASEMEVK